MKKLKRTDFLVAGLALLAIFQLSVLAVRRGPELGSPSSWFQVGENVTMVRTVDSGGDPVSVANGEPTVLLVFRSDCGHCQTVAPLWRDWIGEAGQEFRVVAVTTDPPERARAFVSQEGWGIEVFTVEEGPRGGPAHALTARTPWVFILDGNGIILAEGHGNQIAAIGTAIQNRIIEVAGR